MSRFLSPRKIRLLRRKIAFMNDFLLQPVTLNVGDFGKSFKNYMNSCQVYLVQRLELSLHDSERDVRNV